MHVGMGIMCKSTAVVTVQIQSQMLDVGIGRHIRSGACKCGLCVGTDGRINIDGPEFQCQHVHAYVPGSAIEGRGACMYTLDALECKLRLCRAHVEG